MFTSHAEIADIFCDVKSNDISNNGLRAHNIRYLKMMLRRLGVCAFLVTNNQILIYANVHLQRLHFVFLQFPYNKNGRRIFKCFMILMCLYVYSVVAEVPFFFASLRWYMGLFVTFFLFFFSFKWARKIQTFVECVQESVSIGNG